MIFNNSDYNNHWQTLSLDELGTFKRGKSKHRPRNDTKLFEDGVHPLVQTGEIKEANLYITKHSAAYNDFGLAQSKLWPKGTLCITIAANIAETSILSYPMCFPDSVVGFNAIYGKSTELFAHYVFTYIKRAIQNAASGSIQDNINIDFLTKLRFKVPFIDEQKAIAKVLSDLDAKIELNNKINAELEAMAKLIYDYWFVQFDFPFDFAHGKPNQQGKPYKSSGGKMVYNEELKREIPVGWEVQELSKVADVKAGGDKPKSFAQKPSEIFSIPIYSNGITNDGLYGYTNKAKITKQSISISARGTIGYCVLRNEPFVPIIRLLVVTPFVDDTAKYFYEFLKYLVFENSGSVQQQLTVPQVSQLKIILPLNNLLQEYDAITSSGIKTIEANKKQNQQLVSLRDWLLPMLMNGQVTVKKAEEKVGELGMVAEKKIEYKND